jgi:copper chaperone CopZ
VRKALAALPWVRQVRVDFDKQLAVVTADARRYDEKALIKALEKAGYGGKVVK